MRTAVDLAVRPDFAVRAVTCQDDHAGWSAPESPGWFGVVLVQRGRFRRASTGGVVEVDPTVGYVTMAGDEERFAHPAGGDVCTSVTISTALWQDLTGIRPSAPAVYVDARLELAHRRLLSAARGGDHDFAVAEELLGVLAAAVRTAPVTTGSDALAAAAREAIGADHPAAGGLVPLARLLGVSPYRLSRAFSRGVGVSLTHYRNRVRVGRALDRLAGGEPSLAALAAELGFADQAHLARTVKAHAGHTPAALRRLLA
ncbi:MAG TPA: AraC family transcriptional regulator [Micromonosporaceae bacterium]|jgi:AraC-like DNA-binding protein|nr:AraC family transcriptional regulator [Micromonosporaceae bacterium]